jgi:hypothetical protein
MQVRVGKGRTRWCRAGFEACFQANRCDSIMAVCSCLYQATVSQQRYRGARTGWVWYIHGQTGLVLRAVCLGQPDPMPERVHTAGQIGERRMWRKIVLLTLLSFWICGCLATSGANYSTTSSSSMPRYGASTTREEVPTPRMLGINLDLSTP